MLLSSINLPRCGQALDAPTATAGRRVWIVPFVQVEPVTQLRA
jgi:hypothetical protein